MNKNINDMYYIPEISDIRIGYECEILERKYIHNGNHYVLDEESVKEDKWKKIIIDDNVHSDNKLSRIAHFFIESSSEIKIRTPFLTKEQIESEGWIVMNTGGINPGQIDGRCAFSKGNYFLVWESKYKRVDIILRDPSKIEDVWTPERFRAILNCPSINEFREITNKFLKNMLND